MPWTERLSVGIDTIDDQHKMLFEKADQLFEAGKNQKAKEFISELLDFLDEYTKKHFKEEEQYMLRIKYPELENQKKLHKEFIEQLGKLKSDYASSGGNVVVIITANQMVLKWLTNHIGIEDKKIGEYVKSMKA